MTDHSSKLIQMTLSLVAIRDRDSEVMGLGGHSEKGFAGCGVVILRYRFPFGCAVNGTLLPRLSDFTMLPIEG